MHMESLRMLDAGEAPSLAPEDRPIDLVHLARTTLGDRGLEREVLQLFDRQATLLIQRMRVAASGGVMPLAHTLKGSARGARAAEAVEVAEGRDLKGAVDRLAVAAEEARALIAELLKAN
jgi:hypothetical protein